MAAWSDHSATSMLRKGAIDSQQQQQQHGSSSGENSSLVAMLSTAGLRAMPGLEHHPHPHHHHHHSATTPPPPPPLPTCPSKRPLYATMLDSLDETGDGEIADDGSTGGGGGGGFPEKKRRLSVEQVRSLELSFETENRLEPVRKMQLAQELGLQPRQVAVWFQNRRARWKTKQLEKDYDVLKAAYEALAEENKRLKAQLNEKKLTDNDDDGDHEKKLEQQQQQQQLDENMDEDDSGSAAAAVVGEKMVHNKPPLGTATKNKSSGVEDDDPCTTPDSPTVVSSKFKGSPLSSSDGYNSDVLDAFSPHPAAAPTAAASSSRTSKLSPLAPLQNRNQLPAAEDEEERAAPPVKVEPVAFPYKLDEDDALRGLEDDASYSCLFGAAAEEEQGNWASWWDWSCSS